MPSGAKKRKAAKRKKAKQSRQQHQQTHNENYNLNGNDDPRSHDERESDDGTGSPASHDHDVQQHPFAEGNEESGNTHDQPFVAEEESVKDASGDNGVTEKAGLNDEGAMKIEREFKPEENIEITDSSTEQDRSSSSSNSSSDDEHKETEKKPEKEPNDSALAEITCNDADKPVDSLPEKAMQLSGNAPLAEASVNTILEIVPVVDSSKPVGPVAEEQVHIERILEETSSVSNVTTAKPDENAKKLLLKADGKEENSCISSGVVDAVVDGNEDKRLPLSDAVADSSNVLESVKRSGVPESSVKEPLVAQTPLVVQKTSWMNCCGLFDVFTGSSR